MSISGGRNDTVMDNRSRTTAPGASLFVPYPGHRDAAVGRDPVPRRHTELLGTLFGIPVTIRCLYEDSATRMIGNTFTNDGFYGNPTNGDFAELTLSAARRTASARTSTRAAR